jgi:hypothetical protein
MRPEGKMKSEYIEKLKKEMAEKFEAGLRADEVRKKPGRSLDDRAKTLYDVCLRKYT